MDAPVFEVERFLRKQLDAASLAQLQVVNVPPFVHHQLSSQEQNATLQTEIASLDSDMQLLVYENYSKFITATDTVKAMKCNVERMDSRMTDLQSLIGTHAVITSSHPC